MALVLQVLLNYFGLLNRVYICKWVSKFKNKLSKFLLSTSLYKQIEWSHDSKFDYFFSARRFCQNWLQKEKSWSWIHFKRKISIKYFKQSVAVSRRLQQQIQAYIHMLARFFFSTFFYEVFFCYNYLSSTSFIRILQFCVPFVKKGIRSKTWFLFLIKLENIHTKFFQSHFLQSRSVTLKGHIRLLLVFHFLNYNLKPITFYQATFKGKPLSNKMFYCINMNRKYKIVMETCKTQNKI
jgi:hypothetical protein